MRLLACKFYKTLLCNSPIVSHWFAFSNLLNREYALCVLRGKLCNCEFFTLFEV